MLIHLDYASPTCLTGMDSVSEDYLECALQICASSSSCDTGYQVSQLLILD